MKTFKVYGRVSSTFVKHVEASSLAEAIEKASATEIGSDDWTEDLDMYYREIIEAEEIDPDDEE